jgi:hypothetical protein
MLTAEGNINHSLSLFRVFRSRRGFKTYRDEMRKWVCLNTLSVLWAL